jgi:competence protein ComEA
VSERAFDAAAERVLACAARVIGAVRDRFTERQIVVIACTSLGVVIILVVMLSSSSTRTAPTRATPPVFDAVVSTTSTTQTMVVVHVAGAVRSPGLYRVPSGSRVADAIEVAGGVGADVDIDRVNLAAPVVDGARVFIARAGEPTPEMLGSADDPASVGADVGPMDLNTATQQQLESLPGIGPSTAAAILEQRRRVGRFARVEDLLDVRGIGAAKLDQLRSHILVH